MWQPWIIFHPEPVLLLGVLIILRRLNPNSLCMFQGKSEVSYHKDIISKLITSKDQILANYADDF